MQISVHKQIQNGNVFGKCKQLMVPQLLFGKGASIIVPQLMQGR